MSNFDSYSEDKLVSLKEAADLLGYCVATMRRKYRSGEIRGIKGQGKTSHIKFRVGDLRAYVRGEVVREVSHGVG